MKMRLTTLLLLAALTAAPGFALAGKNAVEDLAEASGLSVRQVQMVLGARTAFVEYRTSFNRVQRQLIRAIGRDRYEQAVVAYRSGDLQKAQRSAQG